MKNQTAAAERVMTALLTARPDAQEELLQTLRGLASEIERLPGCTTCLLAQDVGGGPRFLLYMGWKDPQAMRAGMASEAYRVLRGATSTLTCAGGMVFLPTAQPWETSLLGGPSSAFAPHPASP